MAALFLLAAYALLPEQYRFSRALILFGALLAFVLITVLRWALVQSKVLNSVKEKEEHFNTVITGTGPEYEEAVSLLRSAGLHQKISGRIAAKPDDDNAIGYYKDLKRLYRIIPFREVIFCCGRLPYSEIVKSLDELPAGIMAKIHATGSGSIVGSQSKDLSGESVSHENGFKLSDPYNRRPKRLVDVITALISIIVFPVQFFIQKQPISFFQNCFAVLFTAKTWIGYAVPEKHLPPIRKGIIACNGLPVSIKQQLPHESLQMMDYSYARDYDPVNDLKLIWKVYRSLGV